MGKLRSGNKRVTPSPSLTAELNAAAFSFAIPFPIPSTISEGKTKAPNENPNPLFSPFRYGLAPRPGHRAVPGGGGFPRHQAEGLQPSARIEILRGGRQRQTLVQERPLIVAQAVGGRRGRYRRRWGVGECGATFGTVVPAPGEPERVSDWYAGPARISRHRAIGEQTRRQRRRRQR